MPRVAPVRERGLKYRLHDLGKECRSVAPVRERGLKYKELRRLWWRRSVAPVRERGLKLAIQKNDVKLKQVAPVRERGLKWCHRNAVKTNQGRSRKGTWIEIWNTVGFSVLLTQITHSD